MAEDARVRGVAARGALVAQVYQSPRLVSSGMRSIWRNGDVWGLWMCVGVAGMYGAPFEYGGATRVYGARNPMKIKNVVVECALRTLCVFGNIRGRHWTSPVI